MLDTEDMAPGATAHKAARDTKNSSFRSGSAAGPPTLANETRILDHLAAELERAGLVGEARAAKLVYLVLTSRSMNRPLSALVKGQSSAGKSYLVERVMALFPSGAYHFMTGTSERALAYGKEPLVHRILIMAEAAGLSKGVGAYLLRSLLSEGFIHYETVENVGGELKSHMIHRDGPTGLLATTTSPRLEAELETRMFSIPINDTPEQTSAIMLTIACESDGSDTVAALDPAPWHELQTWLESGERRVVIPYSQPLSRAIRPAPFG